jgi:predicted GNAT family acetyltransferase
MENEIIHENNKFYTIVEGLECHLEYMTDVDDSIVFYHTYVPPSLRGRGLAMKIIKEGLDYAISNNLKFVPVCSAVKTFVRKYPEYEENMKL